VIGTWLADRNRADWRRRAVAVDGKTLRGAKQRDGRRVHLLAAMDHATQRQVNGAPGEVPGFHRLLADLELTDTVVTADALHTHADAVEFLVTRKHAHYLFTVKANQPTLLARCQHLPWRNVPVLDRTRDRAHGRIEPRTLKVVSVGGFGFPHTAQVIQVTRKVGDLRSRSRRWRTVVVYTVTSLSHAQASPGRLADLIRGHWAIENALHYVRDATFTEDALPGPDRDRPAGHGLEGVHKRVHAARWCSWRRPPSKSRRCTGLGSCWRMTANWAGGSGGCRISARWGRWLL
jgi:predicted transposase YbfD/YdcC